LSEGSSENDEHLEKLFSSTIIIYFFIGLAVFLLLMAAPVFFTNILNIPSTLEYSYNLIFFVLGLTFFVKMVSAPICAIPYSIQRMDISSRITLINITFVQIANIILVTMGLGVLPLIIVQLVSAIFIFSLNAYFWKKLIPALKFKMQFSFPVLRILFKDGIWVFIINVTANISAQLDKFVLSAFWGPNYVSYYSASQMLPEKISATGFSISQVFFPIFSKVNTQEGGDRNKNIFRRSIRIITFITAGLTAVVLVCGYKFIYYWISKEFADNTSFAIICLAFTYFIISVGVFYGQLLSGLRALKVLALSGVMMAAIDIAFMFILIPFFKIDGAALAYLISTAPIPFFLFYIERRFLNSGFFDIINYYGSHFLKVFVVGLISFIAGKFLLIGLAGNIYMVILIGMVIFAIYCLLYWAFKFFKEEDIFLFKEFFNSMLLRFKNN